MYNVTLTIILVIIIYHMKRRKLRHIPESILICRTDKLGDFVLSLPAFLLIKKALPKTKIIALTQEYTKPIAELCDGIDEIITVPKASSALTTIKNTVRIIKPLKVDVSISLFTTATLAIGLFISKIRFRVAPATKIDQLFYNFRLRQRRSQSLKPEFEYNLDLVKYYLDFNKNKYENSFERPTIKFQPDIINNTKQLFCTEFDINKSTKLIFVHVGSGGSANNLSPTQYADLINQLTEKFQATFVLCEGPEDTENVEKTISLLKSENFVRYISNQGLLEFTKHIAMADFFISGSTGPLHLAGALDIPTAGFYPNRRSATSTRWKTLNSVNNFLAFSPNLKNSEDMSNINMENTAITIQSFIKNKNI
ncbi:MAG: glycosyltransferase family 9 protein [Thiohalomonadales bacterium]